MSHTVNARIPPRVEQKLAEYCAKRGITRSEAVVRALDHFIDREAGGISPFSLAADLVPAKGAKELQSDSVRKLARRAFGASRAR
jgi:hypothetical protein